MISEDAVKDFMRDLPKIAEKLWPDAGTSDEERARLTGFVVGMAAHLSREVDFLLSLGRPADRFREGAEWMRERAALVADDLACPLQGGCREDIAERIRALPVEKDE